MLVPSDREKNWVLATIVYGLNAGGDLFSCVQITSKTEMHLRRLPDTRLPLNPGSPDIEIVEGAKC